MTSYVDLRAPGNRTVIQTLVKGCRREHALEDANSILLSPVKRFRDEGESLIRDEQEGLATEKTETVEPETPGEALRRQRAADVNEAMELLDSGVRMTSRETSRRVSSSSKRLAFGKEWWIFSTSIKPETEEEWAAWRATLDPAYDHETEIGQPAKFAEALGRMVTEQMGPQSKDSWKQGSIGKGRTVRTKHPTQWILHGPVVYADRLYDALTRDGDEATRLAASIFSKSATHAAQREYRFAILCDRTVTEKELLTISGMMRDALQPTTLGHVRPAPTPYEAPANKQEPAPPSVNGSTKLLYQRGTVRERVTQREESRWETRGADGVILSSKSEHRENVRERTVTRDWDEGERDVDATESMGRDNEDGAPGQRGQGPLESNAAPESSTTAEDIVKEIALEESVPNKRGMQIDEDIPIVHAGTGQAYKSFAEMLGDPALPMGPASEPWAEKALSREEVLRIYKMVAMLAPQDHAGRHRASRGGGKRLLARDPVHPQHLRPPGRHRGHRCDRARTVRGPPNQDVGRTEGDGPYRGGAERRVRLLLQAAGKKTRRSRRGRTGEDLLPFGPRGDIRILRLGTEGELTRSVGRTPATAGLMRNVKRAAGWYQQRRGGDFR